MKKISQILLLHLCQILLLHVCCLEKVMNHLNIAENVWSIHAIFACNLAPPTPRPPSLFSLRRRPLSPRLTFPPHDLGATTEGHITANSGVPHPLTHTRGREGEGMGGETAWRAGRESMRRRLRRKGKREKKVN